MRRGISEFQNFHNILFKMYIFQQKIRRNTKSDENMAHKQEDKRNREKLTLTEVRCLT